MHFTQREATEAAQGYLSLDPLTKDEKQQVKDLIGGFRFDSPFGKDVPTVPRRLASGSITPGCSPSTGCSSSGSPRRVC